MWCCREQQISQRSSGSSMSRPAARSASSIRYAASSADVVRCAPLMLQWDCTCLLCMSALSTSAADLATAMYDVLYNRSPSCMILALTWHQVKMSFFSADVSFLFCSISKASARCKESSLFLEPCSGAPQRLRTLLMRPGARRDHKDPAAHMIQLLHVLVCQKH